jgi:poly(A) polymerase
MIKKKTPVSEKMHNFKLNFIPRQKGVYIVGGSVRDALLGQHPKDYDIAVTGDARGVAEKIARRAGSRAVPIGKPGKMIFRVVCESHVYDIIPADQGLATDLKRRDFTINAMAYDVYDQKLIDPLNGQSDLVARTIRMTGADIFEADPLRLLRAFRIAAGLSFDISPETMTEIERNPHAITMIAGERVRDEWLRLLEAPGSIVYLRKMDETGLLGALFPELAQLKNRRQNEHHAFDMFEHTFEVYKNLEKILGINIPQLRDHHDNATLVSGPSGSALIRHAALFHDIGKPSVQSVDQQGKIHFFGHEKTGAAMSNDISTRLRFSTAEKNYAWFLIRHHLRPLFLYLALSGGREKVAARTRFYMKTFPFTTDLILLSTADMLGKDKGRDVSGYVNFARETIENYFDSYLPKADTPRFITGNDLIERFDLLPSPFVGEVLAKLDILHLSGNITTLEEAWKAADNYIKSKNPT